MVLYDGVYSSDFNHHNNVYKFDNYYFTIRDIYKL